MNNYYLIIEKIRQIQDGEDIPIEQLEALMDSLSDKLNNYRYAIKSLDAENDFYSKEISRLQAKKKANEKRIIEWKDRCRTLIKEGGTVTDSGYKVSTLNANFSVTEIKTKKLDDSLIDPDYYDEVTNLVLNRQRLDEAIAAGDISPYKVEISERLNLG